MLISMPRFPSTDIQAPDASEASAFAPPSTYAPQNETFLSDDKWILACSDLEIRDRLTDRDAHSVASIRRHSLRWRFARG